MATVKKVATKSAFRPQEHVVYPAHGVGQVQAIEKTEFAGHELELIVVTFAKDKMTLRVPVAKAKSVGMRKLADADTMKKALDTVAGRARVKRTMWSRRAQEYEAKINSGDLVSISEVVRDLYRAESQPEQSYSERQLYEAALDRMSREIAAINKTDEAAAIKLIETQLSKSPKRATKAEEADADADEDDAELQEKAA
ncbi:CarD family transcriptional regulator [Acuticoccus sp. M5D2P5]|uniref:CarD family transcriptional regulator n=1 Tax=Acuticoccus kalidii TaxID=2910977 RepID=UPI001F3E07A1|nr:CarD family transcriptional regulator [Acuticoccus kalidii]MCF3933354.1 CarD family transcriptional regulator [Acuticoccus kalidii]